MTLKYYLDITLLPDAEASLGFLWKKVYQQVHLALVKNGFDSDEMVKGRDGKEERLKKSRIAVSFPKYRNKPFSLGDKLRLFAQTEEQLQKLDIGKGLNRLNDYIDCSFIVEEVPQSVTFVRFKRVQFNTNIERLARRRAKRNEASFEQAMKHFDGFKDQESKRPFINIISLSSKKDVPLSEKDRFRLFIKKEVAENAQLGSFNCYGLSSRVPDKQATVPWF